MENKRQTKWGVLIVSEMKDTWNDLCILYKKIKPVFNVLRILFSIASIIIFVPISIIALYVAFDIQNNTTNIPLTNIPLPDQYLFEGLLCLAGAHIAIQTLMKGKCKE